jgi:hypothetical protein
MQKLLILLLLVVVSSCSREVWRAPMAVDTTLLGALPPGSKYKFTGPVTFTIQHGQGNVATATATGKVKADAAATGPGSTATSTKPAGLPWYIYAAGALLLMGVGFWLRSKLLF